MGGFFGLPSTTSSSGGGGGIGASVSYAPASGSINPAIPGFGPTIGRVKLTLSGNTSFISLPAGTDAQQLFLNVVAGNFTLTLVPGATLFASNSFVYGLDDTAQLYYDGGLAQWVLVA